jgi:hypothetical protein
VSKTDQTTGPAGRKCVFCGRGSLTREHVFPDWISSLYGKKPGWNEFSHNNEVVRKFPEKLFQHKAKVVCENCNSGWMSDLEDKVRPFLADMITSAKATVLTQEMQDALSFWVVKTMLMNSKASPGVSSIPESVYKEVYESQSATDKFVVLIGWRQASSTSDGQLVAHHSLVPITSVRIPKEDLATQQRFIDNPDDKVLMGGALMVGHVGFHVMFNGIDNFPVILEREDDTLMLPLHPYDHDFHFPATLPIEMGGGVEDFINAFSSANNAASK